MSMATFAELLNKEHASAILAREARDIPALPVDISRLRLKSLVTRHNSEWNGFLGTLPPNSWLSRQFLTK